MRGDSIVNEWTRKTTDKEQNSIALMNVNYYDSKAEYMTNIFADVTEETSEEDFNEQVERGLIFDITCGTYNGATREFTPWTLTDVNILDTILNALHENQYCDTGYYGNCTEEESKEFEEWSSADWIRAYTEDYNIFIIGNNIYVSQD